MTSTTNMAAVGVLVMCLASAESGGNSTDDFVAISTLTQVQQVDYTPRRTISGASQIFSVLGGTGNDSIAWTQAPHCRLGDSASATPTQTMVYTITDFHTNLTLHGDVSGRGVVAQGGRYRLCYRPTPTGLWERQPGVELTVVGRPTFHPITAVAGMPTPLTFNSSVMWNNGMGDYTVLKLGNCSGASRIPDTGFSLAAIALTLTSTDTNYGQLLTTTALRTPGPLVVCYASQEAGGDSEDDYAQLGNPLTLVPVVQFSPNRTVSGAAQLLRILGGGSIAGSADSVAWTKAPHCLEPFDNATASHTRFYRIANSSVNALLHGSGVEDAPAAITPEPGLYRMCYKPTQDGLWTHVTGRTLEIIAVPSFAPLQGMATTITTISFSSGTAGFPITDGDLVVLAALPCHEAFNVTSNASALGRTALSLARVQTLPLMHQDTQLRVCYASRESYGDSPDDFIELEYAFRQSAPMYWEHSAYNNPSLAKNRIPGGAAHILSIQGSATGRIALIRNAPGVPFSCQGAAAAGPVFDGYALWLPVQNETATLPGLGASPLSEGQYSVCFCGSVDYPGCNHTYEYSPGTTGALWNETAPRGAFQYSPRTRSFRASSSDGPLSDRSSLMAGDTMRVITPPRIGPVLNPGMVRVVQHTIPSIRVSQDLRAHQLDVSLEDGAVEAGDLLYLAPECGPSVPNSTAFLAANTTSPLPLHSYLPSERSALITLPPHLHTSTILRLRLCFTTRQLALEPPQATDFVLMPDELLVIQEPQWFGGYSMRSLSGSAPDYKLYAVPQGNLEGVVAGDRVYFAASCNAHCVHDQCTGLPTQSAVAAGNSTAVLQLADFNPMEASVRLSLPSVSPLVADGTNCEMEGISPTSVVPITCKPRSLEACFQTWRTEGVYTSLYVPTATYGYVTESQLHVDPYPVAAIPRTLDRSKVFELNFNGNEGDYFVLNQGGCSGIRHIGGDVPGGPSFLAQLEAGGVAREKAIGRSHINELEEGNYQICYATQSSEADADHDFVTLSRIVHIFVKVSGKPRVQLMTSQVGIGEDILVQWASNSGLEPTDGAHQDWIGIYRKGECSEPAWWSGDSLSPGSESAPADRHHCHLQVFYLQQGLAQGELRFQMQEAGEYEVRFFQGNSRNGQGYVCRKLAGLESGDEGFQHCVLEAAAVSEVVTVVGTAMPTMFGSIPGLENVNVPYMY